ncbi:MAG: GIY-YIG nuclease family protein [Acidimicrobiia bacterium]|nr:GIY-YIG nuclease family protein [bacterium]MXX63926.1 GIY-YIG nuclease family protein [Acidimicrobiia bacterium]MYD04536.1 GIY-YIG nuclease family protein [Acidimicrobiia bacterium]MYF26190.1 GIY-YIG nuclease family protein [Acidimicrobiia bacterium]MYH55169.1 GIY-YIG nuclease family protein [Acidimicrobiia bacterium]
MSIEAPPEVKELYAGVKRLFDLRDETGRRAADCTRGIYLFIDYDGEPIYVGQTTERLRSRIGRHLTNQRTDAVAMRVLDPFEVAEVEMWPFWELENRPIGDTLNRAEYTVYQQALHESRFSALLNEGEIKETELIRLPPSVRGALLPTGSRQVREHPDLRLARRARTISDLARVISERQVRSGIRRTLWVQSQRLEHLARTRLEEAERTR